MALEVERGLLRVGHRVFRSPVLREPVAEVILARELLAAHEHHVLEEVADALEAAGAVGEETDVEVDGARRELHASARTVFLIFLVSILVPIFLIVVAVRVIAVVGAVRAGVVVHWILVAVLRGFHARLRMWIGNVGQSMRGVRGGWGEDRQIWSAPPPPTVES